MRVPPNALDAERAVVGGVLLENDAMNVVMEILSHEDFYSDANGRIYEAMHALFARSQPIDHVVNLHTAAEARGATFKVGSNVLHDRGRLAVADDPRVKAVEARYAGRPGIP
jgi:replicative DNA helicase